MRKNQLMSGGVDTRLGIDVGAGRVKAVVGVPHGTVTVLRFDGAPFLDAGVFVDDTGTVLVGAAARQRAAGSPQRFVPHPLRLLSHGPVPFGPVTVEAVDLVAASLRAVAAEAAPGAGGPPRGGAGAGP